MIQYVCGFYVAGNDVLLIRKLKPEWQRGKLNGVGGKVEGGEAVGQAMTREFAEEAGLSIDDWVLRLTLEIPGNTTNSGAEVHFYVYRGQHFPTPSNIDEGSFEWVPLNADFNELATIPNLRWVVPLCLDHHIAYTRIKEVPQAGEREPKHTCKNCGLEIKRGPGYWYHVNANPRHPALPKE